MKKIYFLLFISILPLIVSAQYMVHIGGNDSCDYSGDGGLALNASFSYPTGICRDTAGNLYIAVSDYPQTGGGGSGGKVRKIDAVTGIVTTVVGGPPYYSATDTVDNIPATATCLGGIYGICIDKAGNLLVGDGTLRLRSVNLATGIITTVAGNGGPGYWGDGGPATAAPISGTDGVAVDTANNIYMTCGSMVRKVSAATGIISTVAGRSVLGYGGDGGPATAALLNQPIAVCVDRGGNLYIADRANNNVRMVSAVTGIITTVAGNDTAGYSGDGGPATAAKLRTPYGIAKDNAGNLYISDKGNYRIRKVDSATGIITTYAGNGNSTFPDSVGEGRAITFAEVDPWGLCFDTCDNLFFADIECRIRAITPTLPLSLSCSPVITTAIAGLRTNAETLRLWPNPATGGQFTLHVWSGTDEDVQVAISNVVGQVVERFSTVTNKDTEVHLHVPAGVYYINARLPDGAGQVGKVVVE